MAYLTGYTDLSAKRLKLNSTLFNDVASLTIGHSSENAILLPTIDISAIRSLLKPPTGLLCYCPSQNSIFFRNNNDWRKLVTTTTLGVVDSRLTLNQLCTSVNQIFSNGGETVKCDMSTHSDFHIKARDDIIIDVLNAVVPQGQTGTIIVDINPLGLPVSVSFTSKFKNVGTYVISPGTALVVKYFCWIFLLAVK